MRTMKQAGEAAQAAFLHEALERGFIVAEPYGDSEPFDTLVGHGGRFLRVQVKTTNVKHGDGSYHVNISRTSRTGKTKAYTSAEVDFIVMLVGPERTWYVVPIAEVKGRISATIRPQMSAKGGPWRPYLGAWHLFHDPNIPEVVVVAPAVGNEAEAPRASCSTCKMIRTFLNVRAESPRNGKVRLDEGSAVGAGEDSKKQSCVGGDDEKEHAGGGDEQGDEAEAGAKSRQPEQGGTQELGKDEQGEN